MSIRDEHPSPARISPNAAASLAAWWTIPGRSTRSFD